MLIKKLQQSLRELPLFKKVVVGVSGGADSVALASLLIALGYDITVAHLNHNLRGKEGDADERFVVELMEKWGVECVVERAKISKKGNLENNARLMRYCFLEKVRRAKVAKFIAVAHHQDDQIETILMHMKRGAGLRGLRGMEMQNCSIIRPLLGICKQELIDYLKGREVDFRVDESNFDTKLSRNFVRHMVIPEMRKKDKNFDKKLLEMSEQAKVRLARIEKQAKKWIRTNVRKGQFDRLAFLGLPEEAQAEILFQITGRLDVYRVNIEEIKTLIQRGRTGKRKKIGELVFEIRYGNVSFDGVIENSEGSLRSACLSGRQGRDEKVESRYDNVHILRDKTQLSCNLKNEEVRWKNWKIKYTGPGVLKVRSWKPGDRFRPAGMHGTKKLQDFFVDEKIPKKDRLGVPIIVDQDDRILSVADLRFAEGSEPLKKHLRIMRVV